MEKLPEWVQIGAKWRAHQSGELWHVRGIVDDRAICRYWRSSKQRWEYDAFDALYFFVHRETIIITK